MDFISRNRNRLCLYCNGHGMWILSHATSSEFSRRTAEPSITRFLVMKSFYLGDAMPNGEHCVVMRSLIGKYETICEQNSLRYYTWRWLTNWWLDTYTISASLLSDGGFPYLQATALWGWAGERQREMSWGVAKLRITCQPSWLKLNGTGSIEQ